jgi:hypothetical protein
LIASHPNLQLYSSADGEGLILVEDDKVRRITGVVLGTEIMPDKTISW